LLAPVVTNPKKAANTLNWAVNEMTKRYALFAEQQVREIQSYNASSTSGGYDKLPLILIVIDELADLMATCPNEVEDAIARLTAMARAAGIHLIIATQRPSVDVITGVIKANIPSRVAFAVSSQVDSRTIIDGGGAEKLLGKGDMLYFPLGASKPIRTQGSFVTDKEVERITTFLKKQNTAGYDKDTSAAINTAASSTMSSDNENGDDAQEDDLLVNAVTIIVEAGYASISLLQRRMNVGYPRAARLIDRMQEKGYVGPFEGSKPRKVLITTQQWAEYKAKEGV
jgi:S-DNA-T family DNA segregation ATPase FtsK/SpoIIIE